MVTVIDYLNEDIPELSHGYLRAQIDDLRKQATRVKHVKASVVRRLAKLLIDVRSGRNSMTLFGKELKSNDLVNLKEQCNRLIGYIQELQEKSSLIYHLDRLHLKCVDVCDYAIDQIDIEQTIEQKISS